MIFLYIGGGIVALIIILALISPKSATLNRSVSVNVTPEEAFQALRSLKTFDEWSPWADRDPNQERGYRGTDGEVGSQAWWKGNKQVGEGEQEIMKLEPNSLVEMQLRFFKPFKATNKAWFKIEPEGSGSKVTWGFYADFKPPTSIFMMFMNFEKTLGADYEKGLNSFKSRMETATANA